VDFVVDITRSLSADLHVRETREVDSAQADDISGKVGPLFSGV
jgi:hypothetical protein